MNSELPIKLFKVIVRMSSPPIAMLRLMKWQEQEHCKNKRFSLCVWVNKQQQLNCDDKNQTKMLATKRGQN